MNNKFILMIKKNGNVFIKTKKRKFNYNTTSQ